jgi:large subunit ribosomal protein L4
MIKNWQGEAAGEVSLDLKVAHADNAAHVMHRALVRQLANARQGTVSTKTRSEVKGGGRKPWRQKGTGRARAGSTRSPLMPGGGVVFGPKPRDYTIKMNKKERRLALRTAVQSRSEQLVVVEDFANQLPRPKTRTVVEALQRWGVDAQSKILMILPERQESVYLSVRNMPNVKLITASNLNIFDVLNADAIVATSTAIEKLQEVYSDG